MDRPPADESEPAPHWRDEYRVALLLARGARWAEEQPGLLGPVLAAYRRTHGVDDAALAAILHCGLNGLYALALHQRPSPTDPQAAVAQLAHAVGCDAARLATLLEEMVDR